MSGTRFFHNLFLSTSSIIALMGSISTSAQVVITQTDRENVYEITGLNFGSSPSPVLHEDFEGGSAGQPLVGWDLGSSHGLVPVYTQDFSITGAMAGKSSFVSESFNSTAEFKNLNGIRSAYLSYYVKIDRLSGDPSRNVKLARLSAGYSGGYAHPLVGITLFDNNSNGYFYAYTGEGEKEITDWFGTFSDSKWHRIEHYVVLSDPPGNANGKALFWIDGKQELKAENIVTEWYGNSFQWLTLPYYVAHSPGGDYNLYYDNISLNENMARVEICQTPDYIDCRQPVVANNLSWTNDRIVISLAAQSLEEGQFAYIFDSKGSLMNAKGASLCENCPLAPELQLVQ